MSNENFGWDLTSASDGELYDLLPEDVLGAQDLILAADPEFQEFLDDRKERALQYQMDHPE